MTLKETINNDISYDLFDVYRAVVCPIIDDTRWYLGNSTTIMYDMRKKFNVIEGFDFYELVN